MKADQPIKVVQVTRDHLTQLEALWQADWLEEHPGDDAGAKEAAAGIRKSLDHYDCFRSDSFWLFAAQVNGRFVGYASVVRIPKVDNRLLFLFIDELFVLKRFRRQGIATALLKAVGNLGNALSAEGIRLVVASENEAARGLYQAGGFTEREDIFSEQRLR